jgi:hypothetical protein
MIDMFEEPVRGREAIVEAFGKIIERFDFVAMTSFVTGLVVEGDRATGQAYSQEILFAKDGSQKILCGCFSDEYVRIEGRWHFQSRTYQTLYRAA